MPQEPWPSNQLAFLAPTLLSSDVGRLDRCRGCKKLGTKMKMLGRSIAVIFAAMMLSAAPRDSLGAPLVLDPVADASLYLCDGCNPNPVEGFLLVAGYVQGVVKFSTASFSGHVDSALLSLNPYALPLFGPSVDVYGIASNTGDISMADADTGTFLGTLILPPNLTFGQDAFFDVSSFLQTVSAPFVSFNLRTPNGGTDVFSSLEASTGHPSQLTVSFSVAEPSTVLLVSLAMAGLIAATRQHGGLLRRHLWRDLQTRPTP